MFVIRHFEENLVALHDKGVFGGHYHLYVGQEATGVPALACLRADDYLFTTHRNHGHLLARGVEPKKLFAEILGRVDGLNKGKGGSFHSVAPSLGFLHSSGVVAGIIPLSTGTAYASKAQKNGRLTVCLFGDGSLEEGAAPEAFNLASLLKLPVLFLCENNGKYGAGRAVAAAQSTPWPPIRSPICRKPIKFRRNKSMASMPAWCMRRSPKRWRKFAAAKGRNSSKRKRCAIPAAKPTGRPCRANGHCAGVGRQPACRRMLASGTAAAIRCWFISASWSRRIKLSTR